MNAIAFLVKLIIVSLVMIIPGRYDHAEEKNTQNAEPVCSEMHDDLRRFYGLTANLLEKFEAGEIEAVKSDINELKNLLPYCERDWNYGNAVHYINIVEGRMALREGKTAEAGMYLLAAGKTRGSPQLDSFGPNMSLAKELLEIGETQVVIQYIDLCDEFWKLDFGQLRRWKRDLKKGRPPDFELYL